MFSYVLIQSKFPSSVVNSLELSNLGIDTNDMYNIILTSLDSESDPDSGSHVINCSGGHTNPRTQQK